MGDVPAMAGRRRWPFLVAAAVAFVGLLAAVWWFVWVPNWRPSLREGERSATGSTCPLTRAS